jgi:hypothetical protein
VRRRPFRNRTFPLLRQVRFRALAVLTITGWLLVVPGSPCRTVDLPEDTEGTGVTELRAHALLARGWYGDPSDHAERLYSPGCRHRTVTI